MKLLISLLLSLVLITGVLSAHTGIHGYGHEGLEKPGLLSYDYSITGTKEGILEWVAENIKYESDMDIWGVGDYWQSPQETMLLRTGDCEDFTILAMALLYSIGIYSELVLCDVADGMNGSEWEDEPDRDHGGHAVLWIYESVEQNVATQAEWKHNLGYYEPQTGRKIIYQHVFFGHLTLEQTMEIAYVHKSMNPDKFRIPESIEK